MNIHRDESESVISTSRLRLICATVEIVVAELESPERFANALDASVPVSWPPALYDRSAAEYTLARLQESPAGSRWWMWYIVLPDNASQTLIGTSGFKGPPNDWGVVDVGYGLLKEYQRQGYVTEAVDGLVKWAFAHPGVKAIRAQTLPNLIASIGVMKRNRFTFLCDAIDEGMQTVIYELSRESFDRDRP